MTLRALIEAVEAGTATIFDFEYCAALGHEWVTGWNAYRGSLDAANALHDALLPGWGYLISKHDAEIWREGEYPNTIAAQVKDNRARAWLLAILRAKEAEGKP